MNVNQTKQVQLTLFTAGLVAAIAALYMAVQGVPGSWIPTAVLVICVGIQLWIAERLRR